MHIGGNDAKLKTRLSKSLPFEVKMLVEFIRRGISVLIIYWNWVERNQKSPVPGFSIKVND